MKPPLHLILLFTLAQILPHFWANPVQADSTRNIYSCINQQGKPMTVVDTIRGRIKLIVWESDYFRASGWTPEKRCQEVTQRFQKFSDEKMLRFIANGTLQKYPVLCVSPESSNQPLTREAKINCREDNLLITLEPRDNPIEVMKKLFEDAVKTGAMPLRRGQAVLDLEQYFATAPLIQVTSTNLEKPPENTPNPSSGETKIECSPLLCD